MLKAGRAYLDVAEIMTSGAYELRDASWSSLRGQRIVQPGVTTIPQRTRRVKANRWLEDHQLSLAVVSTELRLVVNATNDHIVINQS